MWFFGRKKTTPEQADRSRLLELVDRWRAFGSEELDQPHLEKNLKTLADRLDQEVETYKTLLQAAGERGMVEDVDFLFEALIQLPEPPENEAQELKSSKAQGPGDSEFSWERAEKELGLIARVVTLIRVAIQQRIRQSWQKQLTTLEKRVAVLLESGKDKEKLDQARSDLESNRQAERNDLSRVDQDFRSYLTSLRGLHDLYNTGLKALAGVKSDDGELEIIAALRNDERDIRALAVKTLKLRNFVPTTTEEKLDFYLVPARVPETEAEASKRIAEVIRATTNVEELVGQIEPRLAEAGLTELQALLLEHLCSLHSEKALDRLTHVMASSLEPPALKVKVAQALPDIGTTRAVELLIKAMDELDMEVRAAAADALGKCKVQSAKCKVQSDSSPLPSPQRGEGVLSPQGAEEGKTEPAIGSLEQAILTTAMERLVFALRDGDVLVRETAAKALKHYPEASEMLFASLTRERNPNAREYAAKALEGFTPSPAGTEVLLQALKDEDSAVRKAAADALTKQGQVPRKNEGPGTQGEKSSPLTPHASYVSYLCARQNWKELRRIGRPATACLVSLIRDRNEEIRLAVVELLGDIRAADAVKELCVSLSDSNQEVRQEAASALRQINDPSALDALRVALVKEGFKDVKVEIQAAIDKLERKG